MKIQITQQPQFQEILNSYLNVNDFEFKYLKHYLDEVIHNGEIIYETSYFFYNQKGWILALHGEILYIYGHNYDEDLINEFSENINLNIFNNFEVVGTSDLIRTLIEMFTITNHQIIKERLFYKSSSIINLPDNGNLLIREGGIADEEVIAILLQKYYEDEYNGENNKTIEEMRERAKQLLNYKNIFVLVFQEDIVAFCTLINPDIGIIYTEKTSRNKGFGSYLLSSCSKKLLKFNDKVYLMTDINSIESNNTVKKVGFNVFYKHLQIRINCS